MSQKAKKNLFYIITAVTFLSVLIYEFLTPMMSDDIVYYDAVKEANNFFDLFVQEYHHYIDHTGRSVAHIIMRIFYFIDAKAVFNVVAALMFTLLSHLIYKNVAEKEEYDPRIYALIVLMMWLFDPAISNTVFWETGACNYLFTTTIIMGFVTLFRKFVREGRECNPKLLVGMCLYGIVAGWCNENTSGAVILFVLIELYVNRKKIQPYMISSLIGSMIGFVTMCLAPGNFGRLGVTEEEHTGLMAMVARFLKITLNIKNGYFVLVCVFIALLIIIRYMDRGVKKYTAFVSDMALFGLLFVATCYALIMVPSSELRSYYGASIFLMTAVAQGVAKILTGKKNYARCVVTVVVALLTVYLGFTYIEEGANLARIKREFNERDAYLQQKADEGEVDVYAPMLRPQWETRFSAAYESDIQEDWHYWINQFYSGHYGLDTVSGVEREEWTEY